MLRGVHELIRAIEENEQEKIEETILRLSRRRRMFARLAFAVGAFALLCLGVTVGVMMVCYVAVPARLLGVRPRQSRRDKLWASGLGSTLGVTVCTPPYVLGRVGLLWRRATSMP